ncbi:poly A polymerase head domain-containing protein [Drepanopeziza brunnea f. sp. 'multigermtubi' MB_m1]|uniref:Poly A polymerase head domain-containing protein n=1 Tax=Marssonina brunnea f. sp. multigermtubi (strain MB_m1) TaxID=1072389 RepID=K1WVN9_MARBU|nr:poly A polymerase head domain-containing protein [Drepanopeziza brunnea f. sp. 'multigermtubi' MB_m1]EKD21680.1 poly A polymerase head domain-containing protein [Drepanopeziza brunnea f. sp. 'multigermtubi' MB_m1]
MATRKINLTPRESQLRELLLDVARYIDESKQIKEKIELRFAGGWVRDKLLGIPSHDIDTAINAMTGYAFSTKMQEYLKDEENLKKHALEAKDLGNLHKILANPEKSKHLETATTKIFGFDVDFVNLRKETYSDDSRNPQMEFGTAEEDSLRRDATINALFYNLGTDLVEDFTSGLEDLAARRIQTPLEPKTTFTDDPLRVLRLIRFASRLDFNIDAASEAAMGDPVVMEALKLKISRERVGVELEKMLKGPSNQGPSLSDHTNTKIGRDPKGSLALINRLGLYSTIFTDPTTEGNPVPETTHWPVVYECLDQLKSNETPGSVYKSLVRSDDAKYLSWILAALTPLSQFPLPRPANGSYKIPLPLGFKVAREGLKLESKICNVITGAFRHREEITELKNAIKRKDVRSSQRDTVGMTIRRWDAQGGHWRLQALFAILVDAFNQASTCEPIFLSVERSVLTSSAYGTLFSEWQEFIDHLEGMDIMDAAGEKSIIDGKVLCKELGGIKPGIWMRPALDVVMEWQLRNQGVKDYAGAIEEVKKRREELKIPAPK